MTATAGCGKAPTLTSGTHTISSGGQNRTYILSIPSNYQNDHPYRLVFAQHWLNGTANDVATGGSDGSAWAFYGQKQLSSNSTIFVAPQGIDNGWANPGGRDLTLMDDLNALAQNNLCVDASLIFAMGWSYGGAMSYALACARPAVFRAVVVYSGANLSGCSGGTQPVAYFGIHGTHDSVLNISNGRSLRDTFVRNNGCTAQTPPEPSQGSLRHITTVYSGCRAGFPVQWAAFDGDHIPDPVDGSTGASGVRTWTSAEAWKFISQFASTTTPPTTPPATTPPPTTTPPATGSCRVGVTVNPWNSGLTESITLTNTTGATVSGWKLVFTLPSGQQITGGWSATYAPSSGTVTATNVNYNGVLAPGASTTIGFQATHTGNSAAPSSFVLNGTPCSS
ncbi:MAG TPA: cellulose binding domain-containing protein [Kineosporiaceae bacterium]|nr:cellulose binding domain-containing protein [Kineosporiaceae bacterium]